MYAYHLKGKKIELQKSQMECATSPNVPKLCVSSLLDITETIKD